MKVFYFSLFSLLGVSFGHAATELPGDGDNLPRANAVQNAHPGIIEGGIIAPPFLRDYRNLIEEGEAGSGKKTKNARSTLHGDEEDEKID